MNEQIKQIAERLRGLREDLAINAEEMATSCDLCEYEYLQYESGEKDIPIGLLHTISSHYGIEMTTLLFGDEPRMNSYYVTRKGQGVALERSKAYKYESLAAGFSSRKGDPFIVTVEPSNTPFPTNAHKGQEFNYVLEGSMTLQINGKKLILEEGDAIYFNAELNHGMQARNNKQVKFLAVIV
jgi:mannose-6-phosphate isomerase-like protein (cupin superfamily)